jgi:hypothetical protein
MSGGEGGHVTAEAMRGQSMAANRTHPPSPRPKAGSSRVPKDAAVRVEDRVVPAVEVGDALPGLVAGQ